MADDLDVAKFNGLDANGAISAVDLENLKQDILKEVRKELAKTKQEIVDGKRQLTWKWWKRECFADRPGFLSAIRLELGRR